MLGETKIGKNRETTWIFEKGNCKPIGKDRETISNYFFLGNVGKRHQFLRVVTVNRSGKNGKQVGEKIAEFFFREKPRNDIDS